jgi:hypothetical protein
MLLDAYDAAEKRWQDERAKEVLQGEGEPARQGNLSDNTNARRGKPDDDPTSQNYVLRSAASRLRSAEEIEDDLAPERPIYRDFDERLRQFFSTWYGDAHLEDGIIKVCLCTSESHRMLNHEQIRAFESVDVIYQSLEDWRAARDILRCKPDFHTRKRYDGVLLNTEDVRFARLEGLFRCTLPSGVVRDVAMVRPFRASSWRPRSSWNGCQVVELTTERDGSPATMFVSPEYFVRGVLLVDTDLKRLAGRRFFVDDVVDNDIFLRMGN